MPASARRGKKPAPASKAAEAEAALLLSMIGEAETHGLSVEAMEEEGRRDWEGGWEVGWGGLSSGTNKR